MARARLDFSAMLADPLGELERARRIGWLGETEVGAVGVLTHIAGLVFAGHKTTKNQLGWMVALLAERPDVWDAVASATLTAAEVVEEVMRLRGAATTVGRTVTEPVEVQGERFEPGTRVPEVPHVGFGHGPHFCLGAAFARAELQEALAALAARLHCPTIEEGATWGPPMGINGPTTLPIRFARRGGGDG